MSIFFRKPLPIHCDPNEAYVHIEIFKIQEWIVTRKGYSWVEMRSAHKDLKEYYETLNSKNATCFVLKFSTRPAKYLSCSQMIV